MSRLAGVIVILASGLLLGPISYGDTEQDCGLHGTLQERIGNCGNQGIKTSMGIMWMVVMKTKTKNGQPLVLHRDMRTGIIWSNPLTSELSYDQAVDTCRNLVRNVQRGTLPGRDWSLPSEYDYGRGWKYDGGGEVWEELVGKAFRIFVWTLSPNDEGYESRPFEAGTGDFWNAGGPDNNHVQCLSNSFSRPGSKP